MTADEITVGMVVRGCPVGTSKRRTGHVVRKSGWLVIVETLPNRNGHTRTVVLDPQTVEVVR